MKKKHLREIERINKSIPKELLDKLMVKKPMYSATRKIIENALRDAKEEIIQIPIKFKWWSIKTWGNKTQSRTVWMIDDKVIDKKRYQNLLDSGELDKTEEVVNPKIEKQINEYLDKEFAKARKLRRLPPPQRMPKLKDKSKKIYVSNTKTKNNKEEN